MGDFIRSFEKVAKIQIFGNGNRKSKFYLGKV
jgi:hypothetical protein